MVKSKEDSDTEQPIKKQKVISTHSPEENSSVSSEVGMDIILNQAVTSKDNSSGDEKHSSLSRSSLSPPEKIKIGNSKEISFIVPYIFDDNGEIRVKFNTITIDTQNRPSTHLVGNKQGDHTTAYIIVMQMLVSAVEGETIEDAVRIMVEMSKCFLAEKDYEQLTDIENHIKEGIKNTVIIREERKKLTAAIRVFDNYKQDKNLPNDLLKACQYTTDIGARRIKQVIKNFEQSWILNGICLIGEKIVKFHQNDSLSVMDKVRVENVENRPGAEGSRVKTAMLNLKLLNQLVALKQEIIGCDNINKYEMVIKNYKEIFKGIIKSSKPNITKDTTIDKNFNQFLEQTNLIEIHTSSIHTLSGINKAWIDGIDLSQIKTNFLGELFNDLFDFRYVDNQSGFQKEEDFYNLLDVSAKHIVCVFNAFKHLNNLNLNVRNSIIKNFVEKLLKPINQGGQGWKDIIINNLPVNTNLILKSINDKVVFDNQNKRYSLNKALVSSNINQEIDLYRV